jgi:hypothetical protein
MSTPGWGARRDRERRDEPAQDEEPEMTYYLFAAHTGEGQESPPMSDEDMRRGHETVGALEAEMRSADVLRFGGRLADPRVARVVRPTKGRIRMTDGPFAETKEQLGGIYLIEAADDDTAAAWASKVALAVDTEIEVRAFVGVSPG